MKRKLTVSQEQYKKNLIQKIQINKSNVFSNDEERKEFMLSRFGVDSTTKMSIDQLKLLLDFCNGKVRDISMLNQAGEKEFVTQAQKEKIRTVWKEKATNKDEKALLSFINRSSEHKIERIDDLLKGKATKVIVALENMKPQA